MRTRGKVINRCKLFGASHGFHLPQSPVIDSWVGELRDPARWRRFVDTLFTYDWVVYAKPAFAGVTAVLRYPGRYTHRVQYPVSSSLRHSIDRHRRPETVASLGGVLDVEHSRSIAIVSVKGIEPFLRSIGSVAELSDEVR